MTAIRDLAHRTDQELLPDQGRVIAKLYLPGEEISGNQSRVALVVQRLLDLNEEEVGRMAAEVTINFGTRHRDLTTLLLENGLRVSSHITSDTTLSDARTILMGAAFTAEFAIEGAALCNPSAVVDPDQRGMRPGELRVVISVRGIGEGHASSLGFASAIIGPDRTWTFEPRKSPVVVGTARPTTWINSQYRAVLENHGVIDDLAHSVLAALPDVFTAADFRAALANVHPDLSSRPTAPESIRAMRHAVESAYESVFPDDIALSQQVLIPTIAEESSGIEDARFVQFTGADNVVEYRATYTAYNGHDVAPRLIVSPDLRSFRTFPLTGPAARNKGMALFPRMVGDRFLSLSRTDGETTSITSSLDGLTWDEPQAIHGPGAGWELLQVGNCGSPIEIEQGWLVLTHGVGPMRTYAIGAMLLDIDDPTRVLARLDAPLLAPSDAERDGYVPNVVYSCGGLVHEGTLWLPYGIGDARIGVVQVPVDELVSAMTPVNAAVLS